MEERPEGGTSGWAAEPISAGPPARFRSSLTRAKWAMVLVGIATAAILLLVVEAAQGFNLLDHVATTTIQDVEQWQRGVNAAVGLNLITEFVAAIAFLAWLSRVVDNVPALGGGQPNTTPRWAIGWWFVPIASWFKPYQVVADVWRRLATGPREVGTGVLLAWWVLWIGGGMTGNLVPDWRPRPRWMAFGPCSSSSLPRPWRRSSPASCSSGLPGRSNDAPRLDKAHCRWAPQPYPPFNELGWLFGS